MDKSYVILWFLLLATACGEGSGGSSNKISKSANPVMVSNKEDLSKVIFKPYFEAEDRFSTFTVKGNIPKKSDSRYTTVVAKRDKTIKDFNYTIFEEGLRDIKISGLHLILGGQNSDQVFDLIRNTTDVQNLEIDAETVEINDLLRLASANVTIRAKEIIFNDHGMIDTTPINKTERANLQQDGADGLKAGNITLFADKFTNMSHITLIANGGKGQDAGPGQDGSRGHNAKIVLGPNIYESEEEVWSPCRDEFCRQVARYPVTRGRPSGNGQNAIPGGRPGSAGDAGIITVNQNVNLKYSANGGTSGVRDQMRFGGEPGIPVYTCKRNYKGKLHGCVTAIKGLDAEAPKAVKEQGITTSLNIQEKKMVSPDMTKMQLKYAKDLYKINHVELAQKAFSEVLEHLDRVEADNLISLEVRREARALENQIILHRDYFGKTKTWTPNLAFEVSFKAFDQEVKRNLKLLYFSHWLQASLKDVSEKREAIKNLQDELFDDVEVKRATVTDLVNQSAEMSKAVEDLKVAEEEFDFELKLVEKEILEKAKDNLEVPFHKKALSLISVASKAIPVGQPTFGLVGTGLDLIDQVTAKDADYGSIVKQIPDLAKSFKKFDWKSATKEFNQALKEIHPSEFSKLEKNEQKLEYFNKIGKFSAPIYSAIDKQIKEFRTQEVSKSKLELEIQKIKNKHSGYNKLIKALDKLHVRKEDYRNKLTNFYNNIESALVGIDKNYMFIASSYDELLSTHGGLGPEFDSVLTEIKEAALDRLHYYHYLFSKSYEYRYLKSYSKKFNFESIFEKMTTYINLNSYAVDSNVEKVQNFYEAELANIISDIVSTNENLSFELVQEYNFTSNEMDALNNGEKIFIDLTNFFDTDKEDIRLRSVKLMDHFSLEGNPSDLELKVQHSGKSVFKRNGVSYLFEHSDINSSNLTWISYKGQNASQVTYSSTSSQDESIFREMFGLGDRTEIFIRPGGETFLSVQLKKNKNTRVNDLSLNIEYDSKLKNN